MNHHAMLLDCTLRDGAYLIDKKFGDDIISGIIEGLVASRIDCIEIGFFQDDGFGEGKTVFKNSTDAKRFVPDDKNGAMFTVLADCSRYSINNLDECKGDSIDAVRECFFKDERFKALENCRIIKEKGYKCFVQPVDILGYSDIELIEFINAVNEIEPYCLSIVDTFGSMYQEDLHRIFELIHHNLNPDCKVGFHSHNNMQLSNALSQEFISMTYGKRNVVVDGTISGMGRGAGNTPTELVAQYMVSQRCYNYDIDSLLDIIDDYMDNIKSKCSWGYSTPYFVAGCYSAHVNNIAYLSKKNTIRSKDIRYILNRIGAIPRKRYDYDLIEKTYFEYLQSDVDDSAAREKISNVISNRNVLILVPGNSIIGEKEKINNYIDKYNPVVISVSFVPETINIDYAYMSNMRRYSFWKNKESFKKQNKILTSNVKNESSDNTEFIVSFNNLVKCGWDHVDNSTLMLFRFLDLFNLKSLAIAGFDGYDTNTSAKNYVLDSLEIANVSENPISLNNEISSMLDDYFATRTNNYPIKFVTTTRFNKENYD